MQRTILEEFVCVKDVSNLLLGPDSRDLEAPFKICQAVWWFLSVSFIFLFLCLSLAVPSEQNSFLYLLIVYPCLARSSFKWHLLWGYEADRGRRRASQAREAE